MTNPVTQTVSAGEWISSTPDETFRLGKRIGEHLVGGEVLLLNGPLGAGKTIFVKGIAAGLNVDFDQVTSPTFTLVNPYRGKLLLYHIDLYRLEEGPAAAQAVDLEDLLMDEDAVVVIEWAERLRNYRLPEKAWKVNIVGDGDDPRRITIYST